MARILIIEDDPTILKLLRSDLELEGYKVATAANGIAGLERAKAWKPDLIILDLMLPGMTGYEICRTLRKEGAEVLILMLTARGQEAEKVVGLEQGADDYVTKPYGAMELIARVKALLRRSQRHALHADDMRFDDVRVNFKRHEASKGGRPLTLTFKEFGILELLLRHPGEVITRERFLEEVWGYEELPTTRTVDNRVAGLRQKLSPGKPEAYIRTVHSVGYQFVAEIVT